MSQPFCLKPGIPPGCVGPPILTNAKSTAARVKPPPVHRVSVKEHGARMRGHEIVVELGHNQKLMAAMRELDDSPESLAAAVEDANKFLKKKRVKLPAGTTVSVKKSSKGWEMGVRVNEGPYCYQCRYHSETGLVYR